MQKAEGGLKNLAKQAKGRMRSGFWEDYKETVQSNVKIAKEEGERTSNVIKYYKTLAIREIMSSDENKENFYKKVKAILDEEGEVSNMIARLCDENYLKTLSFSDKQRYLFEISESYCECKKRYYAEKKYGGYQKQVAR